MRRGAGVSAVASAHAVLRGKPDLVTMMPKLSPHFAGSGANGRLGNRGVADFNVPTAVAFDTSDMGSFSLIHAGDDHTCGLHIQFNQHSNVTCWGEGSLGMPGM